MKSFIVAITFVLCFTSSAQTSYRIFSEYGDWFMAAKKQDNKITVIYNGEYREEAYLAILEDKKINIGEEIEKDLEFGNYKPTLKDWKKN